MWEYDPDTGGQSPEVGLLQSDLQTAYGNVVTVSNQGVKGSTLAQLLQGSDGQHLTWLQVVANSKAQIVLENFGVNDVLPYENEPPADFQANLIQWLTVARSNGKLPIIEEPNPVCNDPTRSAALDQYVTIIDNVATQYNVPLVKQYAQINGILNWQAMLPDCIHPSDALYKLKEQNELAVLLPIVKGLL